MPSNNNTYNSKIFSNIYNKPKDKEELNLDNPIFKFEINCSGLSRQRAEETLNKYREAFDIYSNITVWIIASDKNDISCIYKKGLDDSTLIKVIEDRFELLSNSETFDDFIFRFREYTLNKIL